jgi:hypothetical protein
MFGSLQHGEGQDLRAEEDSEAAAVAVVRELHHDLGALLTTRSRRGLDATILRMLARRVGQQALDGHAELPVADIGPVRDVEIEGRRHPKPGQFFALSGQRLGQLHDGGLWRAKLEEEGALVRGRRRVGGLVVPGKGRIRGSLRGSTKNGMPFRYGQEIRDMDSSSSSRGPSSNTRSWTTSPQFQRVRCARDADGCRRACKTTSSLCCAVCLSAMAQ